MNDIVDAVKNKENQEAVKGYFRQVWSDLSNNSWKTNVTLAVILGLAVLF